MPHSTRLSRSNHARLWLPHKRPENEDNPRIIGETREYIRDFDRLAQTTTNTAQELYERMLKLYPNRVNPGWALWSSARAVKS